jgi:hypothetical protein
MKRILIIYFCSNCLNQCLKNILGKVKGTPFSIPQIKICLHLKFNFNEHNSVISVQNSSVHCFLKISAPNPLLATETKSGVSW